MKQRVILIAGKMGSGKSTLAQALEDRLRQNHRNAVYRTRFAKILYEMHDAVIEIARKYSIPVEHKEKDLLQLMGTEWGRERFGDSVWANATKKEVNARFREIKYSHHTCDQFYAIIDDARIDSELHVFPDAFTVRLECPVEVRKERCEAWRSREEHPSEVGLDHQDDFCLWIDTSETSVRDCVYLIVDAMGKD